MLKVNEIFGPTIQGEGPSQGKEVIFVRLSTCNLSCQWCDTPYTWNWIGTKFKHPDKFDKSLEVHEMDNDVILNKLAQYDCKAVVISGGEPLLQQRNLLTLIGSLCKMNYWIEVESNGTIVPEPVFLGMINQINCSPKLSNSGDSKEQRVKLKALTALVASEKVFFKFVVGNEKDIEEVWEYVNTFRIQTNRVYLMPLGKTKEELIKTTSMVRLLAQQHGFVFSSRLHVEMYGNRRGV